MYRVNFTTYGSGEWWGLEECLMYCVHWNTRNARLARKSLAVTSPAAGRRVNPDVSGEERHYNVALAGVAVHITIPNKRAMAL